MREIVRKGEMKKYKKEEGERKGRTEREKQRERL
jgi:hypothetical protein